MHNKCVNGTEQDCGHAGGSPNLTDLASAFDLFVHDGSDEFGSGSQEQSKKSKQISRKILRKFKSRLKAIQNQELDEMDLKKALDKIRAEFKSDTESLAQSEISSTGPGGSAPNESSYRRASQIQIDISLDDLTYSKKDRVLQALSRFCGRTKNSDKVQLTVDADGEAQITVPEGIFKTKTTAATKDKVKTTEKLAVKKVPTDKVETETEKKPKNTSKKEKEQEKENTKMLAPPKTEGKKEKKVPRQSKPIDEQPSTMEVKSQVQGPSTLLLAPPKATTKSEDKKKKEEQKQKEKEEKKQKEKEEKERQKNEKAKLKIENENAQKVQKEKQKKEKLEKKAKTKTDKSEKPEKAAVYPGDKSSKK